MSYAEMKAANGEASLHGLYDRDGFWSWRRIKMMRHRFLLVPSLGVIGVPEENNGVRFELLTFYVRPYDGSITCPGLKVSQPFRGQLGRRLTFAGGAVTRADVELAFGPIVQSYAGSTLNPSDIDRTQPFSFVNGATGEILVYGRLGISFELEDGVVASFSIFRPMR
jgi:hypothetical protein